MPRFDTLADWLSWQETLHPRKIDLGVERVARVARRMALPRPAPAVITVAGTNGKGSAIALLAAILGRSGYRTGCYTSPHLLRYNERIVIQGEPVNDTRLCRAFEQVDIARGSETLSYFEFGTLAALYLFGRTSLDVALLEVGLGGRLDAVNIVDPDVALVTSIGIDHSEWLGGDRESIGREKAGIFRAARPAICADPAPPASLVHHAREIGAEWRLLGRDFEYTDRGKCWDWRGAGHAHAGLPLPALAGRHQLQNAAGVLMALAALGTGYPVSRTAIEHGLHSVELPARCQFLPGSVETVYDVAHNPDSATRLRQALDERPALGATWLVLGMLNDKDATEFMSRLAPVVDRWCLAGLGQERGMSVRELQAAMEQAGISGNPRCLPDVATAFRRARALAAPGDRIVVCGSFCTVAQALACPV
ncbi:MAG: bifunctional tetrahydrofolate synthase/dihydrofolate synthase [Gammaproteobacteria bacterium]|jgi:dihydrofolate synthase/folylpolyglutamate synthase